ncbi:MAG: MATE family efflux transporter [Kineothrix sp.]|nr:MATE efflux family protein [Lachnospiraceae bacterium 28-4]MCX4344537.1 MATE family efflux transporter [Kineothrix sp.]
MTATAEKTTLMTEGSIGRKIIAFALPLFLGNLFQQLYNTADSLIVGNFLGSNALAAVSSSGNLIFLMVGFFHGIAAGAGVVIARYYGARELKSVKKAVHTTIAFGLAAGIFLTITGVLLTSHILIWMGTPADVLPESTVYFRIYFMGSLSFVMYNVFVGILQSVGDSRHPLVYLIVSSVINILLDLLFVGVLGFGVGAAAFATILSQFISAFLCLFRLIFKSPEDYQVSLRLIRFDLPMLRQIIANGLPAGFQNSIIALANVVVQSNINKFGKMAVAGCGAYSKIEGFGFLPITCFSLALTTFISQNLGAKQYERAKKGARFGILCSITMAEVVGIFIYFAIPILISAFNRTPEVIAYGTTQARTVTLFYFLLSFSHCIAGILRGAGKASVPMITMLCFWCIVRVSYITLIVRFIPVINVIFWAYPLTWSLSSIVFLIYFLKADWVHGFEK